MKKINFLTEYDLFSKAPSFYIGGKDFYGTLFGFLMSIIAVLAICTCSVYFVVEMFDTKNVMSYNSVENPQIPLSINFTSDTFYFTIAIEDPNTYECIRDESIYNIKAYYKVATRQEDGGLNWEVTPVELEPCQLEKFPPTYKEIFAKRTLEQKYCIKNFNYTIEGTFLHDKYSFIMFDFYKCENTTENGNSCKSQNEIDYYLNGTFASIEFTDISLDPSNYSNPDSPILGEIYSTVGNSFFKEMHLYLKAVTFNSDRGLVFSSIKSKDYIQLDYLNDMFTLKTQENFCSFTLKLSNRIDVYVRTYTKFQTTLANIGGIFKAISVIGEVLTFFYSRTSFELNLTNKIFNVYENSEQKIRHTILPSKYENNNTNTRVNFLEQQVTVMKNSNSNMNINNLNSNQIKVEMNKEDPDTFTNSEKQEEQKKKNLKENRRISKVSGISKYQYSPSGRREQKIIQFSELAKKARKSILGHRKITILSLSLFEKFFLKLCPRFFLNRRHAKFFIKGSALLKEKLDIISLIREFIDLSRLKQLLLTPEQLILFNLVYKPEICLDRDENVNNYKLDLLEIKKEYNNSLSIPAKKAFDIVNQVLDKSIIKDTAFIECLDPIIRGLLSEKQPSVYNICKTKKVIE